MLAKTPSQAKPLILFDVTPGGRGEVMTQSGHIFAQPARMPAIMAGRVTDSQDKLLGGSHNISLNTHSAQEILENMIEAVPFNSTGLTPPAIKGFSNPNPTLLCPTVYDADVIVN